MTSPTAERLASLRARMAESQLDALVVSAPSNIFYLSGFRGSSGALLITADEAVLFSDFRYRLQAGEQAPDFEFAEVERYLLKGVGERAKSDTIAHLGYDPAHLTCECREELAGGAGDTELAPSPGLVEDLRAVKAPDEVEHIRAAASLADQALSHMTSILRPGAVERDIALEGEFAMRRAGAEAAAFDIIVASGPRSALPHAETTGRQLQPGDLVVIDIGARVDGYCSDMTRTFALRSASKQTQHVYRLVHCAQRAGAAALAAGVVCGDVDAAARTIITEGGYGDSFGHGLGHGVGIDVHEAPRLGRGEERELVAGNVVTVEPGVYLPDVGGVRLEDLLLVGSDGAVTITGFPVPPELPIV